MWKMIQLRNVPEALHRRLKAQAARAGLPLYDYLIREARKLAEHPTPEEMRDRLKGRTAYRGKIAASLLDLEVAQVLSRLTHLNEITAARAHETLDDYAGLLVERAAHRDLLRRVWELWDSMTAYDGAYIALAEALDAPLLTCDGKLARSHGHRAMIELVH
jgi:predicted nucleic acid-binding protein